MEFFLPFIEPEHAEAAYTELAKSSGVVVPDHSMRVFSITFTHNGEVWTATVGETLAGIRNRTVGRGRTKREFEQKLTDAATVVAIFASHPYIVWTNAGAVRSKWSNPFYVGEVGRITYFV